MLPALKLGLCLTTSHGNKIRPHDDGGAGYLCGIVEES